jgi:hypothetical protein
MRGPQATHPCTRTHPAPVPRQRAAHCCWKPARQPSSRAPPPSPAAGGSRGSARSQPGSPSSGGAAPLQWSPSELQLPASPTSPSRPADRTTSLPSSRASPPAAGAPLRRGNSATAAIAAAETGGGWGSSQQQQQQPESPPSPSRRKSKLQVASGTGGAAAAAAGLGYCGADISPRGAEGDALGPATAPVGRARRASALGPGRGTSGGGGGGWPAAQQGLPAEVQEAVERLVTKLGSRDWKERLDSLRWGARMAGAALGRAGVGLGWGAGAAGCMGSTDWWQALPGRVSCTQCCEC